MPNTENPRSLGVPNVGTTPTLQPTTPGLWESGGQPMWFDGTSSTPLDFNLGTPTSRFGTPLPGDI